MKKISLTIVILLLVLPTHIIAQNLSPENAFRKNFPKQNFESITPSPVKGIYEVYTGNQIFYYMPENEIIITGNLITKDGVNLTRESNLKKMAEKMDKLPLDSALKIGKGKTKVVEFTDPNCPYCRRAFEFFEGRKDVTLYVFLIPLSQDSEKKIRHIFCSKDKIKAYENVMLGKLDNNAPLNICNDKEVDDRVRTHRELAAQAGVGATPTFFLKGVTVGGFEQNTLEKLLK